MATPHILLGYTKPSVTLPDHNYADGVGRLEIRQSILISLLISIEPIIHVPQFSTSNLECTELNKIRVGHLEVIFNAKSFVLKLSL